MYCVAIVKPKAEGHDSATECVNKSAATLVALQNVLHPVPYSTQGPSPLPLPLPLGSLPLVQSLPLSPALSSHVGQLPLCEVVGGISKCLTSGTGENLSCSSKSSCEAQRKQHGAGSISSNAGQGRK